MPLSLGKHVTLATVEHVPLVQFWDAHMLLLEQLHPSGLIPDVVLHTAAEHELLTQLPDKHSQPNEQKHYSG